MRIVRFLRNATADPDHRAARNKWGPRDHGVDTMTGCPGAEKLSMKQLSSSSDLFRWLYNEAACVQPPTIGGSEIRDSATAVAKRRDKKWISMCPNRQDKNFGRKKLQGQMQESRRSVRLFELKIR